MGGTAQAGVTHCQTGGREVPEDLSLQGVRSEGDGEKIN